MAVKSNVLVLPTIAWKKFWLHICLATILIFSGVVRLAALSLMEFRYDSAYWTLEAHRMLTSGQIPLVGQQVGSVHVALYNGPAMTYVTALIFAIFGYKPLAVASFVALCNVVGVFFIFLLGTRLFSRNVGLLAAALMSVSPWMVLYGRMLWPQSLFPLLITLSMLLLISAIESNKVTSYLALGMLLGVCLQLHLSSITIIGMCILLILLYGRSRYNIFTVILGIAIGYSPIVLYDIMNGFTNARSLLQLTNLQVQDDSRLFHIVKTIWNFTNVLSGQGLWVSKLSKVQYTSPIIEWGQFVLFTSLFICAIAAIFINIIWRKRFKNILTLSYKDNVILLFFVVPMTYLLVSRMSIQRHYFIFLYPSIPLILARGTELLQTYLSKQPWLRKLTIVAPSIILCGMILNVVTIGYGYQFLAKTGGESEYGTVLSDKQGAVDYILAASHGNYKVDVTAVQESLPYVFLFQTHNDIYVEGDENIATSITAVAPATHSSEYRIVELPYNELTITPAEKELYRSRGVVVVGPRVDQVP